jgi:hypothetical protein
MTKMQICIFILTKFFSLVYVLQKSLKFQIETKNVLCTKVHLRISIFDFYLVFAIFQFVEWCRRRGFP